MNDARRRKQYGVWGVSKRARGEVGGFRRMTAFYLGQTTNVSRILALEAISFMSHFTLVEVALMGDNSGLH